MIDQWKAEFDQSFGPVFEILDRQKPSLPMVFRQYGRSAREAQPEVSKAV